MAALQRPHLALHLRAGRDGSTKVTEQWDARPVWNRLLLRLTFAKRNRDGIKKTLQRLDQIATQAA